MPATISTLVGEGAFDASLKKQVNDNFASLNTAFGGTLTNPSDDAYLGNGKALFGIDAEGTGSYAMLRVSAANHIELPNPVYTDDVNLGILHKVALSAAGFTMASIDRTATAAGDGTGTIASGPALQHVTVTCDQADKIIVLPAPVPGSIVILSNGATGYELRSSAPGTVAINGGTNAAGESAIAANTTAVLICATATSWKGLQMGSDGTLAKVEVAAA